MMMEILSKSSFKYKSSVLGKADTTVGNNRLLKKNVKRVVLLKYLSNFCRSLEISLSNCKIHLALNWTKYFAMYGSYAYAAADNNNDYRYNS